MQKDYITSNQEALSAPIGRHKVWGAVGLFLVVTQRQNGMVFRRFYLRSYINYKESIQKLGNFTESFGIDEAVTSALKIWSDNKEINNE